MPIGGIGGHLALTYIYMTGYKVIEKFLSVKKENLRYLCLETIMPVAYLLLGHGEALRRNDPTICILICIFK